MVDNIVGHEIFSFMDGFFGYNHIIIMEDKHKMIFTTPWGMYCYRVISFGLKNAGATYQREMYYILHDYMHDIVKDYVDDLIMKTKT